MSCCELSSTLVSFNDVPVTVDVGRCRLARQVSAQKVTIRNRTPFPQTLTVQTRDVWLSARFEGSGALSTLRPHQTVSLEISLNGANFGPYDAGPILGAVSVIIEDVVGTLTVQVEMRLRAVADKVGAAAPTTSSVETAVPSFPPRSDFQIPKPAASPFVARPTPVRTATPPVAAHTSGTTHAGYVPKPVTPRPTAARSTSTRGDAPITASQRLISKFFGADKGKKKYTKRAFMFACAVFFPFFAIPYFVIGQGVGEAPNRRFNNWFGRLSNAVSARLISVSVILNIAYLVWLGTATLHSIVAFGHNGSAIRLTNATASEATVLIDCTADGIAPALPLYLYVSTHVGQPDQRFPLVDAATHAPAFSGPAPLHLQLDGTLGSTRTYTVKVVAKDSSTSTDFVSNPQQVSVTIPLPKPAGFVVKFTVNQNGTGEAGRPCHNFKVHLSWQAPATDSVSLVKVWRQVTGGLNTGVRSQPENLVGFPEASRSSWTSGAIPVYRGDNPIYQRYNISFEDNEGHSQTSELSKWQRITFEGVQGVDDPDKDAQALEEQTARQEKLHEALEERKEMQKVLASSNKRGVHKRAKTSETHHTAPARTGSAKEEL